MAQAALPGVGTGWHALVVVFQGTRIQVYYDGVVYIDVTDSGFDSQNPFTSGSISLDMATMTPSYLFSIDTCSVLALPPPPVSPIAQNDSYTVAQGTTLDVAAPGVLGNDSGGGSFGLSAAAASQPAHGTLVLRSNGSFTYTPVAAYSGSDAFTYQASAGGVSSNTATVTIVVAPPTLNSLVLNSASLVGGDPVQGTVTLTGPAPEPGVTVTLGSSDPSVVVLPPSVTVSAGSTSATFSGTTNAVPAVTQTTIMASYGNSNQSAVLTVLPAGSQVLFADDFSGLAGADPLWLIVDGSWNVANGVMQGSSPLTSYGFAHANGNWTDYTLQGRIQFPAGAYGGGIGGRLDSATGARYAVWVYPEGSPGGSALLRLIKFQSWTAWSGTAMATANLPGVGSGWHTLLLEFQGNRIQVSYDGVTYIDVTDTGYEGQPTYTSGGASLEVWANNTPYVSNFDDILAQTAP